MSVLALSHLIAVVAPLDHNGDTMTNQIYLPLVNR